MNISVCLVEQENMLESFLSYRSRECLMRHLVYTVRSCLNGSFRTGLYAGFKVHYIYTENINLPNENLDKTTRPS